MHYSRSFGPGPLFKPSYAGLGAGSTDDLHYSQMMAPDVAMIQVVKVMTQSLEY